MCPISNGKNIIGRLRSVWRGLIESKGLSAEFAYRIDKLVLRLDVVVDKVFVKTVKARNMLSECEQITVLLKSELNRSQNKALALLTRLEDRIEHLVSETHAFRVKAG